MEEKDINQIIQEKVEEEINKQLDQIRKNYEEQANQKLEALIQKYETQFQFIEKIMTIPNMFEKLGKISSL
jgi:predicted metal-dependent hydrolase